MKGFTIKLKFVLLTLLLLTFYAGLAYFYHSNLHQLENNVEKVSLHYADALDLSRHFDIFVYKTLKKEPIEKTSKYLLNKLTFITGNTQGKPKELLHQFDKSLHSYFDTINQSQEITIQHKAEFLVREDLEKYLQQVDKDSTNELNTLVEQIKATRVQQYYILGGSLLMLLIMFLWTGAQLTQPLSKYEKFIMEIASGNYHPKWEVAIKGRDEVGKLGTALFKLREKIQDNFDHINLLDYLIKYSNEMIIIANAKHNIIKFSPAFEKLMGMDANTIAKKSVNELLQMSEDSFVKDNPAPIQLNFQDFKGENHLLILTRFSYQNSQQNEFWVYLGRDVTSSHQLEEKLKNHESMIAQKDQEIQLASSKLEHLQQSISKLTEERLHAKPIQNDSNTTDLNSVIRSNIDKVSNQSRKVLSFHKMLNADIGKINLSTDLTHKIIFCLFKNAEEASAKQAKIYLTTESFQKKSDDFETMTQLQAGYYVKLTVHDEGKGIPSETLNQIFDPYFSTKDAKQNNYFGLFMVKEALKKIGGFIEISSMPEQGTIFTLFFPAEPKQSNRPTTSAKTEPQELVSVEAAHVVNLH